jgi:hypothetical protein
MRKVLIACSLLFSVLAECQVVSVDVIEQSNKTVPGVINTAVIKNFSEPMKAIVAYYAALAGSNCDGTVCGLTTALGLGNQGSDAHIQLLQKYFKGDKTAETIINQKCYLPPNTASIFNDYAYLGFLIEGNKVIIQYKVVVYNRGAIRYMESDNDEIWIEANGLKVKKKKLMQVMR